MKEYVLLTGASSGIGYEMATQLAAKKMNLILVARNETKLQKLQHELIAKHGISVRYFVKDLSNVQAAIDVYKDVQQENLLVWPVY
jgi:short-subunit dehydrogenase